MNNLEFYKGRKVLVTGHTGFKGTWMCIALLKAGAEVVGYSLEAPTDPSAFSICGMQDRMHSVIGDIRDLAKLKRYSKKSSRRSFSILRLSQSCVNPTRIRFIRMRQM